MECDFLSDQADAVAEMGYTLRLVSTPLVAERERESTIRFDLCAGFFRAPTALPREERAQIRSSEVESSWPPVWGTSSVATKAETEMVSLCEVAT